MNDEGRGFVTSTLNERAERTLARMVSATADHLGHLEPPEAMGPHGALWRALEAAEAGERIDLAAAVAVKAVCSAVSTAMIAAVKDGSPMTEHLHGIDFEEDGMAEAIKTTVETRRDGFDERCVGGGWPGQPACSERPVVAVGGVHRCRGSRASSSRIGAVAHIRILVSSPPVAMRVPSGCTLTL